MSRFVMLAVTVVAVMLVAQSRPATASASAEAISAGTFHTCAIVNGGAKCWGDNFFGQLGDNNAGTDSAVPVDVQGLSSGVTAISVGAYHTCAVVNGGAKCWGSNTFGQLGDNHAGTDSDVPVDVQGLSSGVSAISSGDFHTCAVVNGGAKCWGINNNGELGDNHPEIFSGVPVDVQGLSSGVSAISAGTLHTCAIVNGGAKCWGDNAFGQLGDNNAPTDSSVPVDVQGLSSGVSAISAGAFHTCAIVNGGAKCWGDNGSGELGNNNAPTDSGVPVDVQGLSGGVTAISAGTPHTCAIVNGGAKCWGSNGNGELGNNNAGTYSGVPVDVQGLSGGVTAISAGTLYTCAIVNGGAKCWGFNDDGELGDNNAGTDSAVPVEVIGLLPEPATILVRKIVSLRDPGRFDLLIDDTAYANAIGFLGNTGAVEVDPGPHTVSEEGAAGTDLSKYTSIITCIEDGRIVAFGAGPSLTVDASEGGAVVCTIYNTRSRGASRLQSSGRR